LKAKLAASDRGGGVVADILQSLGRRGQHDRSFTLALPDFEAKALILEIDE